LRARRRPADGATAAGTGPGDTDVPSQAQEVEALLRKLLADSRPQLLTEAM
jgi:hypothetical protein